MPIAASTRSASQRSQIADFIAIAASVASIGSAIWAAPLHVPDNSSAVANIGYAWLAYFLGGVIGLIGIWQAQRAPKVGKVLVAMAGLTVLSIVLIFREPNAFAWGTVLVIGIVLIAMSPFVGRIPPGNTTSEGVR
jgi:hypothetical protein